MEDIETGEARSLLVIGRDVCAAARKTRNTGEITYLTVNGDCIAAIVPASLITCARAALAEWDADAAGRAIEVFRAGSQLADLLREIAGQATAAQQGGG